MTVRTLVAAVPPVTLIPGMVLKLEAIDPSTGAAVTGVTATAWVIYGSDVNDTTESDQAATVGPFMLVPGPESSGA